MAPLPSPKRILIVGGNAGGASCAARLRRLDERAAIVMFERGPHVSVATCGLPYFAGGVIQEEGDLLVASPDLFRQRFNIEVRTLHEVTRIDRAAREIEVRDLRTGALLREPYDALVLAPGAAPIRPLLPGIDLPGVFTLRTVADARCIRAWLEERRPARAVIVGAGFVGLEMAENLARRGLAVTIVEQLPQPAPLLDPEMAEPVCRHLETHRVALHLGDAVAAFEAGLVVRTESGARLPADVVILAVGVRPEIGLAQDAGLDIGANGGIRVDESMRTSDPAIWAVGDAVEVRDAVTGQWRLAPFGGPANRQGRVAADSICGRPARFRGAQGTAVCGVFGLTIALTGATERALQQAGIGDYQAVYLHPPHHAEYYPGARSLHMKLIFSPGDGRILGAQAVGEEGADKRIDVIAMAIQKRATVFDLEECELCYAPQYGSAKDPVNLAGMLAANVLRGDMPLACWNELGRAGAFILDVRDRDEYAAGHIEGAVNIPLNELRDRLNELPRDREIWLNCARGQRAYFAQRILMQNGFAARNLSGGYLTYWGFNP